MESVHKRNIMSPKTEEINGEKHGDYIQERYKENKEEKYLISFVAKVV